MGALQTWLQLSDELLSRAWGSMDRYHLAWLMVGKPKGIVRGRPMDPDEEAAYVREVATQKTAALRMSLDAVDRQHMPFVGETGGGLGQGGDAAPAGPPVGDAGSERSRTVPPIEAACRPTRPSPIAWPRRAVAPTRIGTTGSGAPPGRTGWSGDRRSDVGPRGRWHATGPGAGPHRRGLPAARPAAGPAHPGPGRRLLRPGRDQGPGRHGAASAPARLREDASALTARVQAEVAEPERRDWLLAQVRALAAHAQALDGEPLPYRDHVALCLGFEPPRHDDAVLREALRDLDALLPGEGPRDERLVAWDRRLRDPGRSAAGRHRVARRAVPRPRATRLRPARTARTCASRIVTGQPWSGYNWYDGGRRSRVDINTDLPVRAPDFIKTVAHETYPGHHLEHAWKEADLVDRLGRMESSMLLINTPECPISEGLADLGISFATPIEERADLLVELVRASRAGGRSGPVEARETAERAVALEGPRHRLGASRGNAALLRHADGASHAEVLAYLQDVGGYTPSVAAKLLEFIEHPLWRTYVFVYNEGEALVRRWVEAVPAPERVARFGRLLHEQVTPGRLLAELG